MSYKTTNNTVIARPFLKWVGGKRQLLSQLTAHLPQLTGTYHEPFLGGGALFFHLHPNRAVLSDANLRLVRTYRGIRDACPEVIALLSTYPHDKTFFLELRARDIDCESDAHVAAWMIYLNKTGFNGLYRVNKNNLFNVPFGAYKNPTICDTENLLACSKALTGIDIEHADFSSVINRAKSGDFVYFDPPYIPLSATSSFTSYTADGFGMEQQTHLRDVAIDLKRRGVSILLSNSSAGAVKELYRDFQQFEVRANRALNCKGEGRGKIAELLIW